MRIDDFEQRLGEARKLGVDLQLDARGEKGGPLDQPLDVRVRHLESAHAEPRGNLRKLLRKLRAHLAEMSELALVVVQQTGIHYTARVGARSATSTCPVSRSISVRTQKLERQRLRPELPGNLHADDVVMVHRVGLERANLQRLGKDARFEIENGLPDRALQIGHLQRSMPSGRRAQGGRS